MLPSAANQPIWLGYTLSSMRYFIGDEPTEVIASVSDTQSPNVDRRTTALLSFPKDVTGSLTCDLGLPPLFAFIPQIPRISAKIECQNGSVELYNYVIPTLFHSITVVNNQTGVKRTEKVYTEKGAVGEDWWTTYRFQLEAFVNQVKGRKPQMWITKEDSVANIQWIENIYAKVLVHAFMIQLYI